MSNDKYKVLYREWGVWKEFRSDKKIRDSASVFIEDNAIKIKKKLIIQFWLKNVKIVQEDFELNKKNEMKQEFFNNMSIDLKLEESIVKVKEDNKVDFSKTDYTIYKNNNIYLNIYDKNWKQLLNFYYWKYNESKKTEIIEDINIVIEEIRNQQGMIFEFWIIPNLEKQFF